MRDLLHLYFMINGSEWTNYDVFAFSLTIFLFVFNPGGCCGADTKKTVIGGWAWAWALVSDVQR